MVYDRKIKYLEYWENGEKLRGAGFVKAELRGTLCRMQISVRGLRGTDRFDRQVYAAGDKQEGILAGIRIEQGRGETGELRLDGRGLGQSGVPYEDLREIRIPLSTGREIRCQWQEAAKQRETAPSRGRAERLSQPEADMSGAYEEASVPVPKAQRQEMSASESSRRKIPVAEADMSGAYGEASMPVPKAQRREMSASESSRQEPPEPEIKVIAWQSNQEVRASEAEPQPEPQPRPQPFGFPLDDKWKQLSAIYPHVTPFEDDRDYLTIGPNDFVIFPSRYYQLVNNSFLLHGYHNYRHLILARLERRGEIRYYVGVPGNFYEKEKQVALMFGFESFECREEPVRSGDYGYYMMRVEL